MIESSASDENDASSLRNKKSTGASAAQQAIPSPLRRHHLKFGVLGKRYSYGYLGKRNDGMKKSPHILHITNNYFSSTAIH
jgi:hypothetical protein